MQCCNNHKKEISLKISSEYHLKELLFQTHNERRKWINTSSSNDLTLLQVLEKFPCFYNSNLLIDEFRMIVGKEKVDEYEGKYYVHFICLRTALLYFT